MTEEPDIAVTSDTLRAGFELGGRVVDGHGDAGRGGARSDQEAAVATLAVVETDGWWQTATGPQILAAWETAYACSASQPQASRALDRIRTEVLARYHVDVRGLAANPAAIQTALAERARIEREAAGLDLTEAAQAMARGDAAARSGRQDEAAAYRDQADHLYARAGRRRRLAQRIDPHRGA
jgi:hypothetical protein